MTEAVVTPMLEPDQQAMRAHIAHLFGGDLDGAHDGLIEICWTSSTPNREGRHPLRHARLFGTDQVDEAVEEACKQNRVPNQNVYVGAALRKPGTPPFGRGEDGDFYASTALWLDIDDAAPALALAERFASCPPSMIVVTGRAPHVRVQCWWLLEAPIRDAEALRAQLAGLARHFEGDPSVCNPSRVMRLAGSIAWPLKEGRTLERTEISKRGGLAVEPYFLSRVAHAYPAAQVTPAVGIPTTPSLPAAPPRARGLGLDVGVTPAALMAEALAGRQWHNNVLRLVGHWITRGWSDAEILGQAAGLTLAGYTVAQTATELQGMIQGGRAKWGVAEPRIDIGVAEQRAERAAQPLPLVWFADAQPNLDALDIVEDTICDGQMSVVYGESNTGKTFFATDLALHLATGTPWRGKCVEAGGVIYVAAEGGFGVRNRVAAFRKAKGLDGVEVPFGIVPSSINLLDPEADARKLVELVKQAADECGAQIKLVVVDTLSRALAGGNENSPEDMGALVMNGDLVRQATGAHLMFIHHSGKDAARGARGHSLLRAATDTEIEVSRPDGATFSVAKVTKQREMAVEGEYPFRLEAIVLGSNKRGKEVTSCIVNVMDADVIEKPRAPVKLTTHGENAHNVLLNIFAQDGNAKRITIAGREWYAVAVKTWREAWRTKYAASFSTPVYERNVWMRVTQELTAKGKIGLEGDHVWLA